MLKIFNRTSTWIVLLLLAAGVRFVGVGHLRTDPTDDFSFTYSHVQGWGTFRLMKEERITQILSDRLDMYPRSQVPALSRHLIALCKHYRFDPAFILALIQVESGFHIKIHSPNGAIGLMQVMPATAIFAAAQIGLDLGNPRLRHGNQSRLDVATRLLHDPATNLTLGIAYLSWLRDHYRGRPPYFLVAAYNIGPARMDELLARKSFKPTGTLRYFNAIRRGVPGFRFYRREA